MNFSAYRELKFQITKNDKINKKWQKVSKNDKKICKQEEEQQQLSDF